VQLYITQGRFGEAGVRAEEAKQSLQKNVPWDFDPLNIGLTRLHARNGNIREAISLCDGVKDQPTRLKLQGEIYILTKQWSEAEGVLDQIEAEIQGYKSSDWGVYLARNDIEGPRCQRLRNALYSIKARIALDKGSYEDAVAFMEEAKTLYPGLNSIPADLIEILGRAYYKMGDLEPAREQFECISRMTYNRKEFGDTYARSFYMLGKIFEEMGDERKAQEFYERFLDLWKDADSGIPEIEDARTLVAVSR
jgi:tetratricopeptide (TPR) repeat protein